MSTEYTEFGRLLDLRKVKNKTISEMAKDTGISASAISNYERGIRKPDADTLIALSKYFDCTTDYLLGLSDGKNPKVAAQVDKLGLSETSINALIQWAKKAKNDDDFALLLEVLNYLINDQIGEMQVLGLLATYFFRQNSDATSYRVTKTGHLLRESIEPFDDIEEMHKNVNALAILSEYDVEILENDLVASVIERCLVGYLQTIRLSLEPKEFKSKFENKGNTNDE